VNRQPTDGKNGIGNWLIGILGGHDCYPKLNRLFDKFLNLFAGFIAIADDR
jgi:hypothetical protein